MIPSRKTNDLLPLVALLWLWLGSATAQSSSPVVIASAGTEQTVITTGDAYIVAWTLGEPAILTAEAGNSIVCQGFHGIYEQIVPVEEPTNLATAALHVFPNPVIGNLTLSLENLTDQGKGLQLSVWNALGQRSLPSVMLGGTPFFNLDCSSLLPGLYLLQVDKPGEPSVAQTIRFIKQ